MKDPTLRHPSRRDPPRPQSRATLGRNVYALAAVSFLTDVSSEMIYPLLPLFLTSVLGATASYVGAIEGAAESTAALLKLGSGWWSDRVRRRRPLVIAGYTIASVMRPLVAMARSPLQVLFIRVGDRVGKGIRNSPRDALIADSVDPAIRGRAFGLHRAADNFGGVVGPLLAFATLRWWHVPLRTVFWLAAIPGALAVTAVVVYVHDVPRHAEKREREAAAGEPLGRRFWAFLVVILLFTLGNSTDAFLLLRARELGVPLVLAPILWALLHVVKTTSNMPGGMLSDRVGPRSTLACGWAVYAVVYFAFAHASAPWHAWALFAAYGVYFGLTEGGERALVSDLVPSQRRGIAFGWYYLAIGLGALPASLIFGALWDRHGSAAAFTVGGLLALAAAIGMVAV